MFACEEEVEGWWGDDDFGIGVAGGGVEVGDYGFDGVDCAVPGMCQCFDGGQTVVEVYILKLPPTKNWRPMIAVGVDVVCAGG